MGWKSWLPYKGDQTVRKKLRELDHAGIGVPMIIILFLQKSFELILKQIGSELPIPLWATFLLAAALTFVTWIYDKQLQEKASEAKDKAKDKVDEKTSK
jgi:hypothetical protein